MKTVHKKPRAKAAAKTAAKAAAKPAAPVSTLPSRESVKQFLAGAAQAVHFRDLVRAFSVAPEERKGLRGIMKSLEAGGHTERAGRKIYAESGRLPENALVEVTGIDRDGEAIARPVVWDGPGRPPVVFMHAEAKGMAALAPGARVLARLKRIGPDKYEGRTIKRVAEQAGSIVGVFHPTAQGGRIEPADRRTKLEWIVPEGETMNAHEGEIVRAEPLPGRPFGAYLERLDTTNYTNEENYQLPIPNGSVEEGYQLLRWGQDGLAVRAYDPVEGSLAGYQLLLFKGPFVLPAEAQSNPVPGLVSVTPATVVHNSGNQFLTATGSGFIPGAVVLWNGVPCSTAYVDASHLQFAVSAADVASPQTISLTAENPGSSQSTSLALAVH